MIRHIYRSGEFSEVINIKRIEHWNKDTYILTWQQFNKDGSVDGEPYKAYIDGEDYEVLKIRSRIENEYGVPSELMDELHDAEYERISHDCEENFNDR